MAKASGQGPVHILQKICEPSKDEDVTERFQAHDARPFVPRAWPGVMASEAVADVHPIYVPFYQTYAMRPLSPQDDTGSPDAQVAMRSCAKDVPTWRQPQGMDGSAQQILPAHSMQSAGYKRPWTFAESQALQKLVTGYGEGNWKLISMHLNRIFGWCEETGRSAKQCRERWLHTMKPGVKKGGWTECEERIIVEGHKLFGNKWSEIARMLPGRTHHAVKNHWNSTLQRKGSSNSLLEEYMICSGLKESKASRTPSLHPNGQHAGPNTTFAPPLFTLPAPAAHHSSMLFQPTRSQRSIQVALSRAASFHDVDSDGQQEDGSHESQSNPDVQDTSDDVGYDIDDVTRKSRTGIHSALLEAAALQQAVDQEQESLARQLSAQPSCTTAWNICEGKATVEESTVKTSRQQKVPRRPRLSQGRSGDSVGQDIFMVPDTNTETQTFRRNSNISRRSSTNSLSENRCGTTGHAREEYALTDRQLPTPMNAAFVRMHQSQKLEDEVTSCVVDREHAALAARALLQRGVPITALPTEALLSLAYNFAWTQ